MKDGGWKGREVFGSLPDGKIEGVVAQGDAFSTVVIGRYLNSDLRTIITREALDVHIRPSPNQTMGKARMRNVLMTQSKTVTAAEKSEPHLVADLVDIGNRLDLVVEENDVYQLLHQSLRRAD